MQSYEIFLIVFEISRFLLKNGHEDHLIPVIENQKHTMGSLTSYILYVLDSKRSTFVLTRHMMPVKERCKARDPIHRAYLNRKIRALKTMHLYKLQHLLMHLDIITGYHGMFTEDFTTEYGQIQKAEKVFAFVVLLVV